LLNLPGFKDNTSYCEKVNHRKIVNSFRRNPLGQKRIRFARILWLLYPAEELNQYVSLNIHVPWILYQRSRVMINNRNTGCHKGFFLNLSIVVLILLFFRIPSASSDNRIVKIGIYENAPKIFISESGQPSGIFIDIIESIAKSEGWRLQYVPGTWGEGLDRLEKREIDLMPDVAYTADREKIFAFHKVPVLSSWFQVYARKGSKIKSILDLAGRRIAVLERSVQQEAFSRLAAGFGLNITLISLPDYQTIFESVARGEVAAAITNRFYGLMHARKLGLEDTAVIFNPSNLFFSAPKGTNKELLNAIDAHLINLKKDPQSIYYQSLKRWTSEEVRFKLPAWVKVVGLVVGVVLLLSLTASIVLKRQVDAHTRALSRRNEQMVIMDRTLRSTTTQLKRQHVLEKALQGVLDLTGLEGGLVCLVDRETGRLVQGASINASPKITADLSTRGLHMGDGLSGHGAKGGKPFILWDNTSASAFGTSEVFRNEGIRFLAAFPLTVRNETIGLLCIFSRTDVRPDPRKLDLVLDICAPVALAIENASLYEQVKGHAAELEQQVAVRTAELAAAMEKAEAADRIKSAFLATMSHELRTPLNSIIGFTGILLQGLAGPLNEEQRKQMTMVQGSSRHLLALINDVLDISKIEAGQLEFSFSTFALKPSIVKMVKLVSPLAEKKAIALRQNIADNVARVTSDQRRLEQVILNLLNNAVKFTEKGHVRISCRADNNHYLLSVSDTGIGMRPEELPGLFQPFHQIDTGLSRKHEGTGLGLSICKKLIDMMGGTIDVQSQWGRGSTFTIRFPRETRTGDLS
jgi:signal transduction histidine kinase/ABC-type amino acid transport substrate-binding protein